MNKPKNTRISAPENSEFIYPPRGDTGLSGALKKVAWYATIVCAVCASFGRLAQAQIVPDAGTILREQQKTVPEVPTRPAPTIKQDEPARPAPQPADTLHFMLKGFRVTGNTAFGESELIEVVREYVGKEVAFADLEQAAARISRYYRERGYMVARAYVPAQVIAADGVAEIAVIEGRFGRFELDNKSRVRDSVARGYLDAFPGTTVTQPALERKMLLLNDLPGVGEARATLKPGAEAGESALTVDLAKAPFASGSVEYNNQGNYYTGVNQLAANVNLLSPLGLGDLLNGQFTRGFDGLEYGRLGYQVPVGSDGVRLGADYSHTHYELGKSFAPLEASGKANTYTLEASYPFKRTPNFNLYGQLAFDWRDFEDRQDAVGLVTDKSTRAGRLTLNGDARDRLWGGGITVFSLGYSSGNVDIKTPIALTIDDATAKTNGGFDKWNVNALRLQSIGERFSVYVSLSGQKAGQNLDSSEKFFLGGANGVRAYPTGEAPGDSGYLATAELRYTFSIAAIPGVLQPVAFVDTGGVTINENPFIVGTPNTRHLSGGGLGLTWVRASDFQIKLTVATRLGSEHSTASDTDQRTRGWAQAIKYF
jgi:hemolysin activation/secretion protein